MISSSDQHFPTLHGILITRRYRSQSILENNKVNERVCNSKRIYNKKIDYNPSM